MLSVRVWNLQSDSDAEVVKFLENEFLRFRQLEYLAIRTTGRSALRKCHKKGVLINGYLQKAIQHYLKQDDYIIFILGSEQQYDSKSLTDEIRQIVEDSNFSDKVFFATDLQKGESAVPMQWQRIISRFRTEVENERKQFRERWDKTMAHFHNAFAGTPEEEIIRDFEEAIAEVRRERS